jgi:hypothetical protein
LALQRRLAMLVQLERLEPHLALELVELLAMP